MSPHAPLTSFGERWLPPDAVAELGRELIAASVEPGDRVGVMARPDTDTALALAAIWRHCAVAVLISPMMPLTARSVVLDEAGASTVVDGRTVERYGPRGGDDSAYHPVVVLPTSGTSGRPRLIAHNEPTLLTRAHHAAERVGFDSHSRWLLSLPTHHIGGFSIWLRAHVTGGVVVERRPREPIGEALVRTGATHVSMVPTQLAEWMDAKISAPTLRVILMGGAPLPDALRRAAVDAGLPLVVSYGSTETAAMVTSTRDPRLIVQPEVAGSPLPDVSVATNARGTLEITGGLYCGDYRRGQLVPRPPGVYDTGDLGSIDAAGTIRVLGRRDAMFQCGGETIRPEALERVLADHPAVQDAVIVPLADDRLGAVPVALIRLRDECDQSEPIADKLAAHLGEREPGFVLPRSWWRLPGDAGLKPARAALADAVARGDLDPL